MTTLVMEAAVGEAKVDRATWLSVVRVECEKAVKSLKNGAMPSNLKPSGDQLTRGEWLAVLEAARREVTRG